MAIPLEPLSTPIDLSIDEPDTFTLSGFDLQAGVTYGFLAAGAPDDGGTLPNPDMGIFAYDPSTDTFGDLLAFNDDSTLSADPIIGFTPETSGEFAVIVGGGGDTGTFQLFVAPIPPEM